MTPATASAEVRAYLDAVRARLDDLDPEAREHLLSDTEASLLEAAEDGVALPLEVRLGPPERFARELRAAAGLPEVAPAGPERRLVARILAHPRVKAARALAGELAPVWWVVRGFLVLTFVAQILGDGWSVRFPVLTRVLGNPVGWLLLLVAIAASVALGRRKHGATGRWRVAKVAVAIVSAWALVAMAANAQGPSPTEFPGPAPPDGLVWDGRSIGNVYPYDRRGRLLQDVRLYDEYGTPLDIRRNEDKPRRLVVDRSGERLFNTFPIRYFERGTRRVKRPGAGALRDKPGPIVTPPVRPPRR